MSRAALHGGPRAPRANRSEAFQNLLLTTLAVATTSVPVKNVDFGRPVVQKVNRQETIQSLAFQLAHFDIGSAGWEEGRPASSANRRDEPQGRNLALTTAVSTPIRGYELPVRQQSLRTQRGTEPQGTNLLLFVQAATTPLRLPDLSAGPQTLRVERFDVLGSPFGLIQPGTTPFVNADMGQPRRADRKSDDNLGSKLWFLPRLIFNVDFGRPQALQRGPDDGESSSYQLSFQQVSTPVTGFDAGRPAQARRNRDDAFQPLHFAPVTMPIGQAVEGSRPRALKWVRDDVQVNLQFTVSHTTDLGISRWVLRPSAARTVVPSSNRTVNPA